jgi:hypothetical protein
MTEGACRNARVEAATRRAVASVLAALANAGIRSGFDAIGAMRKGNGVSQCGC